MGIVGVIEDGYRPSDDEPFMNERQKEYFRRKLIALARGDSRGKQGDARRAAERERKSSRHRRSRLFGDRSRDRTPGARSSAQADLQDRGGAGADRRRNLRVLRRDGRSDLAAPPRRAADRDVVGRGAGTPRTARKNLPRRIRPRPGRQAGQRITRGAPARRALCVLDSPILIVARSEATKQIRHFARAFCSLIEHRCCHPRESGIETAAPGLRLLDARFRGHDNEASSGRAREIRPREAASTERQFALGAAALHGSRPFSPRAGRRGEMF